jgi:VanZ family protein
MAEYGILTALLFGALRSHLTCSAHGLLIGAVIALWSAFSDEWHQTFVPGREGSLRDVGIDAFGVIGASLGFAKIGIDPGAATPRTKEDI